MPRMVEEFTCRLPLCVALCSSAPHQCTFVQRDPPELSGLERWPAAVPVPMTVTPPLPSPTSPRCRLSVEAPRDREPEFAAMVFFDEITRGDAFMCKHLGRVAVGF